MAKRPKKARKDAPEVCTLSMQEIEAIIARAQAGQLSDEDCQKLRDTVQTLLWMQEELATKNVTLARLRSLFGMNSSEKSKDLLDDDGKEAGDSGGGENSDNDADADAEESANEPAQDKGKPDEKPKGHGRNGAADYTGADVVKRHHESLKPGDPCPECPTNKQGKVYKMSEPRRLVRVVGQAPVTATVYELERLRCNLCGKIFTAEAPEGIGDEKYDATAASMIGLLKYGSGMPFNRLERLEGNLGIPLPAATQWEIVEEAAEKLAPLHEELIWQAAQGRLFHNDDTSMRVLDLRKQIDEGLKSGTAESDRTGIFLTGIIAELENGQRISLFFTSRNHAGENLTNVLAKRADDLETPIQMCDGLDRNVPKSPIEVILANCLTHGRRHFVEVLESFPQDCRHVIEVLGEVYKHDATAREHEMSDEDRLRYHQEHSRPLMDDLKRWMDDQIAEKRVEPNSALGAAISYMTKRWDKLTLFLRRAGAPLDNNIVERALKKAILHRKNALFYKTERGAWVGDLFMSLIHTAELAHVNPLDYLTAVIRHADVVARDPSRWMPWNYSATLAEDAAAAGAQ